jgi:hypothetical protein
MSEKVKTNQFSPVCSACSQYVKSAEECYMDYYFTNVMCKECYDNVPTLEEYTEMIQTLKDKYDFLTNIKTKVKPFSLEGININGC